MDHSEITTKAGGRIWAFLHANNLFGPLAGFICVIFGSILFSIAEFLQLIMKNDYFSHKVLEPNNFLLDLTFIVYIFIYSLLFSFIPAVIGGWILALLLQYRFRKGSLTLQGGTVIGALLAGIAVIIICLFVVFFILAAPHGGAYLWARVDTGIGNFIVKLLRNLVEMWSRLWIEIVIGTIIACFLGGLSGRLITKQIICSIDNK